MISVTSNWVKSRHQRAASCSSAVAVALTMAMLPPARETLSSPPFLTGMGANPN